MLQITIKNLPTDVTRAEIADLFAQQGVDATEFLVYQVNDDSATCASGHGGKSKATVLANTECVRAIVTALDIKFGAEGIKLDVSESISQNARSTEHAGPVGSEPSITISWKNPETIIATYESHRQARANAERINGQVFYGRRLYATLNQGPPNKPQLNTTSIKITGWPHAEIYHPAFAPFVAADNVNFCPQTISTRDKEMIHATVSSRKGVRMETYDFLATVNVCEETHVKVSFDNWENAKQAQKYLNRKKLNGGVSLCAWYLKPHQYTIRIPKLQYQAQKKMWDMLAEPGQESDAQVEISASNHGSFVFLNITADDRKAAVALKVRVERLVAGEQLNTRCWHPSLLSEKDRKTLSDRVGRQTRVFVRSDFKTRSVKVYGEPERVEEAKRLIKEEATQLARVRLETTRRLIPPASMRYFVREGLARLRVLFRPRNVHLNLVTRQITIKGGKEVGLHLQRLINEDILPLAGILQDEEKSCALCFNNASTGKELGCGHKYCEDCIEQLLESAREADDLNFPLVCPAIDDKSMCKVPIAIPLLHTFVTPQAFKDLVDAAFTSYLKKHPQELRYCTTPDCKQVYRRWPLSGTEKKRSHSITLQCPLCFSYICPACDEEGHEGMTCKERHIETNPTDQLVGKSRYKRRMQGTYYEDEEEVGEASAALDPNTDFFQGAYEEEAPGWCIVM
ncbi:hypothetical protein NLJ89_g9532 [Agrocybe chaxingu]|uniref:RBR-type E3 ubiquitin transferase n=1 Tax=Agrocybe chaxingu TaxID=84603 RepID=A0A9W8JQL9_9AGAR|nr:hypothetical protein NLJ89_g9532 [Agrocybe chaxingu]